MVFISLPHRCALALRVSGCGGISSHLLLSLLVRSFLSLGTLLTCIKRHLELIMHYAALWLSLGMLRANFLSPGIDPTLDSPDRPRLIETCLYYIGASWGYVICMLLRPLCE